jgi:hypothetical protein
MVIPTIFELTLAILYPRLKPVSFPWAFTGSLSMVLQGMNLEIHDIDLQSDAQGAYAIQTLFSEFVTRPVVFSATERIRSHYGALEIAGVKVEIMGDVESRMGGSEWSTPPDLHSLTRWVENEQMRLPVLDLEYEVQAYLRLGRTAKADQIQKFLNTREIKSG